MIQAASVITIQPFIAKDTDVFTHGVQPWTALGLGVLTAKVVEETDALRLIQYEAFVQVAGTCQTRQNGES